jgi:hypothetical protein
MRGEGTPARGCWKGKGFDLQQTENLKVAEERKSTAMVAKSNSRQKLSKTKPLAFTGRKIIFPEIPCRQGGFETEQSEEFGNSYP